MLLPDVLPWAMVVGFGKHVRPVSAMGTWQAMVSEPGKGAFAGVVVKSIFTVAAVPAVIGMVPEVEESCVAVTPTSGNVWFAGAVPPPACELGFVGFVTVIVTLPAVAR